ncbi:MAG: hydroxymethylbilane synthase [Hydrogenophaga sp.]
MAPDFLTFIVTTSHTDAGLSITIATRESRLALWQAEHVQALLQALGHRVGLLGMTTRGDQILDRSLSKVGGKGLFVKELEVALEEGRADIAVHSLKDVPMDLPAGFALACVMEREDPRDAWVSPHCAGLSDLPANAVIGTSSLRRVVLLRDALDALGRQDVRIEPLRGNLDTRLRKLDDGQYHAIVLAAAGLKRLNLSSRIRQVFEPSQSLPSAGQGALGIEVRSDRVDLIEALQPLVHLPSWWRVAAERTVSRAMGGSCSMPLAAYAQWVDGTTDTLRLDAAWGDPQGQAALVRVGEQAVVRSLDDAEALGQRVATALRAAGARPPLPEV